MYNNLFNTVDDDQLEDRPVLPSISRILEDRSSRAHTSLRLPPLPVNRQGQEAMPATQGIPSATWPQIPLSNNQGYSSQMNYTATMNAPRDPRISALETNQAMSALASVRSTSARQYPSGPYGDPYYRRDGDSSSRSVGHSGYDSLYDPRNSTGYNRNHHAVENMHDLVPDPNLRPRPMISQRNPGSPSRTQHKCSYCDKEFSRPSGLKIHITTHTGEKPYVCPEEGCHRSFSVRSNMRRHVRIVHQASYSGGSTDSSEDGESRDSTEEK
ncbi:MAG: hypothetical protein NXY57DRAFT_34367 [Lentinula lateritia]|nr:MAG: hypothetical protein NXY57DRAFT_34367 [Lentinula lateritia]